jgi:hypothetical protein
MLLVYGSDPHADDKKEIQFKEYKYIPKDIKFHMLI